MGAPVTFTITVASLPPGWEGDPMALLTAFAERLTISPSEPWSSFINGGAQPSSDVGPFLAGGVEWKVWSSGLGTYTFATQNGAGIVNATITRAKWADDTPNSVFVTDAAGRPILVSGLDGQYLKATSTVPAFADVPGASRFTVRLTVDQSYVSDGSNKQVKFDLVGDTNNVTPDTGNFRIPIPANSVWHFGSSLQIAEINGTHTDVKHFLSIRPYQTDSLCIGSVDGYATSQVRGGVQTSGIYSFGGAGYVDVVISSTCESSALNFSIDQNGVNTRFWGYRIS